MSGESDRDGSDVDVAAPSARTAIAGAALVVVVWLLVGLAPALLVGWPKTASGIGDMFGAVNALFSGLAFAGLFYAILLQRRELALQRKELALTRQEMAAQRAEMAGQRQQLEIQARTASRQSFESTFFQMIRTHHEMVQGMADINRPEQSGRHYLLSLGVVFWNTYGPLRKTLPLSAAAAETFLRLANVAEHNLGHYMRNLCQMAKFVRDFAPEGSSDTYASVLRAQLSSAELVLIAYYCLTPAGETLWALVQKFALLKNLPERQPNFDPELRSVLTAPAFGLGTAPD